MGKRGRGRLGRPSRRDRAAHEGQRQDHEVWEPEGKIAARQNFPSRRRRQETHAPRALHKKWTNLQGQSELSKDDLVLVVGYKLTRGKMRPLMRFAEAMHDNEVRKARRPPSPRSPTRESLRRAHGADGNGVATASVCLAAVDDRLPVMSDEALEAVLGEPEHSKKYDLDSYQRLLEARSAKAKKLGGLWTPRAVEEALFSASLEQPAAKRKRGDRSTHMCAIDLGEEVHIN